MILNSANKSEIAVLKIELEANQRGYSISLPRNGSSRYDLIIDDNKKLWRVQAKFLNRRVDGKDSLQLAITDNRTNKKPYTKDQIDLLLVYLPRLDVILSFVPEIFHNKRTIRVNLATESAPTYYKKFLW